MSVDGVTGDSQPFCSFSRILIGLVQGIRYEKAHHLVDYLIQCPVGRETNGQAGCFLGPVDSGPSSLRDQTLRRSTTFPTRFEVP